MALRLMNEKKLWRRREMAALVDAHPVSTLGAEAVAAAMELEATLCAWAGDDGAGIRSAAASAGVTYLTVSR